MIDCRNPVQARAAWRALAWLPYCELTPRGITFKQGREFPVFYNHQTKDYRAVVDYLMPAIIRKPILVENPFSSKPWASWRVDGFLADGEMHKLWVTYVSRTVKDKLLPLELSKRNQMPSYARFKVDQMDLGIVPGNPLYIHPFDMLTKDACIALMLQGHGLTPDNEDVGRAILEDEIAIQLGMGISRQAVYNMPIERQSA